MSRRRDTPAMWKRQATAHGRSRLSRRPGISAFQLSLPRRLRSRPGHRRRIARHFSQALGVRMQLVRQEWTVYLQSQSKLDFDLCRSSWVGDYNDPNTFLDMFVTDGGNNRTGWSNPRYDELIAAAGREVDKQKRFEIFREAENILVTDEMPICPLYYYVGIQFYDGEQARRHRIQPPRRAPAQGDVLEESVMDRLVFALTGASPDRLRAPAAVPYSVSAARLARSPGSSHGSIGGSRCTICASPSAVKNRSAELRAIAREHFAAARRESLREPQTADALARRDRSRHHRRGPRAHGRRSS